MAGESGQSPTPSGGNAEGTDLRSVANQIEGLLDADGHINPSGTQSRALDPESYEDGKPQRDERGRFVKQSAEADESIGDELDTDDQADIDANDEQLADGDDQPTDTETDDQADGDTDGDLAASADEQQESDDADTGQPIETLSELAEAIEFDIDELKESLTHTFNAAGEEVTVTLAELEKGYQRDADYRRGTAENAEYRRAAEQDYVARMQQFDQEHQFMAAHLNALEQVQQSRLNDPHLAALRESNTAEWNARRTEIGEEIGRIQQLRNELIQRYDTFSTQQKIDLRNREAQALRDAMPGFDSDDAALARRTMESLGFNEQEVKSTFDHRVVMAVMELANLRDEVAALRQEKSKALDTAKRVKKTVPRLQKPGKQSSPAAQKRRIGRDALAKAKARAKKSGSVKDAASVIEQMGII